MDDYVINRATHNMYAYRIYNQDRDTWIQDNDDDGESAAGSRMLHLVRCFMFSLRIVEYDGCEECNGSRIKMVGRYSFRTW